MKVRKKNSKVSRLQGFIVAGLFFLLTQTAESQSFSEGKNLFQLRESTCDLPIPSRVKVAKLQTQFNGQTILGRKAEALSPIFLPRWAAEQLPFFCRIEHGVAKNSAVPFKFRLGSVEYVDWLEGKGDWELLRQ